MSDAQTVFIQADLTDGDIGISPVLLQAVNQTLDSKAPSAVEQVGLIMADTSGTTVQEEGDLSTSQSVIIGSNEETGSADVAGEEDSSLMATTAPNKDGRLVIKVISDNFGDEVNQAAIMNQLRQKLGIKVVVQMENTDGNVLFEGTVIPCSDREPIEESPIDLHEETSPGDKENEDVNAIVKSVVNTIRDLSTKMEKIDMKPCPICGDVITGYHYAVQTCESCKGFFKRTVQNKKRHSCLRGGTCDVSLANRKKCAACRFQKCCDVGMKIEGVREDRSRGGRSKYYGTSVSFQQQVQKRATPVIDNSPLGIKRLRGPEYSADYPSQAIPEIMQQLFALESIFEEESTTAMPCCIDRLTDDDGQKFNSMLHITEHRLHQIIKWARHLPDFNKIALQDQMLLLQNSWAEMICLGAIWRSRFSPGEIILSYGKTLNLEKAREMDHEEAISRALHVCANFRRLSVDKYEYVTLKVLALMLPDIKGLRNSEFIQQYQNRLLDALMIHTATRSPNSPTKFGELLLRLSEVQRHTVMLRKQILAGVKNGTVPEFDLIMYLLRGQADIFDVIGDGEQDHTVVTETAILDDVSMSGVS